MQLCRVRPRRVVAFAIGTALAAGIFVGPQGAFAAPTPPPNPTDGQITAAQAAKNSLATAVGRLSAQLASQQQQLQQSRNASALAEQRVARDVSRYRDAVDRSERATAKAKASKEKFAKATKTVADERTQFARYMQAVYMDGAPAGLTGTMLTAGDPNAVLAQSSYQTYEVQHNVGVIGKMQLATVARSNAAAAARNDEISARKLVKVAEQAKNRSIETQQEAAQTVRNNEQAEQQLAGATAQTQSSLETMSAQLATLNGQRATYTAFVVEQRRIEAERQRRIAEAKARKAESDRLKKLAAQRQAAEERQREKDRKNNGGKKSGGKKDNGGSNSGGGGGSSYDPPPVNAPPKPGNGKWTQAKAVKALNRAKSTLGTPYAWAGGGPGGPSYGACVPSAGAPYDCNIRGYDCSGLVMYAWGKNWDHYADTQYTQAGRVHPKKSQLRIGDLVFFGQHGNGGDLHHVAMYAGHGKIIEAPYSGGYVQYNSLNAYSDYYGATRPLT